MTTTFTTGCRPSTSTSISIPGTVNPVTIVVRTGRGAGEVSAQMRFHSPKSPASSR